MDATAADGFDPQLLVADVSQFQTDSRKVLPGEVFFAFSQPEFENNGFNGDFMDASRFVGGAIENGAIACVVRRDRAEDHDLGRYEDRLIYADDVLRAFQNLAHRVCLDWGRPVVGITGSAGKTTAKELTAHLLSAAGKRVLSNEKNLNNGIGHPMTVLRIAAEPDFDIAVLEMAMSSPKNEIARLCRITPPDVGVELNVLPVHVEHLGSIENVAKAKAELIEGLKEGGLAVLNNDDPRVAKMKEIHEGPVLTYAIDNDADFKAEEIVMKQFGETHFVMKTPDGDADVVFQLSGKHNILNALAASAVGYHFGMTGAEIALALENVQPPNQRGEIIRFKKGFTVINDSYNSNPDALLKMVKTVSEGISKPGRRIVISGEMLELGVDEKAIHHQTGREIAAIGVDVLVGVRGLASELVGGALEGGAAHAKFFETPEEAGEYVAALVENGDIVLVKGSRGVKTEKAIDILTGKFAAV